MRLRGVSLLVILAISVLAVALAAEAQQAGKVYRIGLLESPFSPLPLGDDMIGGAGGGKGASYSAGLERRTDFP